MLKHIISGLFVCISCTVLSQTARISHRSHSGSDARFSCMNDNFGLVEPRRIEKKGPPLKPAPLPKDAAGNDKPSTPPAAKKNPVPVIPPKKAKPVERPRH